MAAAGIYPPRWRRRACDRVLQNSPFCATIVPSRVAQPVRRLHMVGPNRFKLTGFTLLFSILFLNTASFAQSQVMGELRFIAASKAAKTSGVWIDGQYVGYLDELKDDRKVMLLPGEHQVAVRQSGYTDFTQQVVVEPGKALRLPVRMQLDPQPQFPTLPFQINLHSKPHPHAPLP